MKNSLRNLSFGEPLRRQGLLLTALLLVAALPIGCQASREQRKARTSTVGAPAVRASMGGSDPVEVAPVPADEAEEETIGFTTGLDANGLFLDTLPLTVDADLLALGARRYADHCAPCHGAAGDGQGELARRQGLVAANLREPRLRFQPAGQLFHTLSQGIGRMQGFADTLPPRDRWALVAHLRRLQTDPGGG